MDSGEVVSGREFGEDGSRERREGSSHRSRDEFTFLFFMKRSSEVKA